MKKILVMIFILVLAGCIVSAADSDFMVEVDALVTKINPGQTGIYDIYVSQDSDSEQELKLSLPLDAQWAIQANPILHLSSLKVQPGERIKTRIQIKPVPTVQSGSYKIPITIGYKDETGAIKTVSLPLYIYGQDTEYREFIPAVNLDVDVPQKVDPRKEYAIRLNFKNRNQLNITDLSIVVTSDLYRNSRVSVLSPLESLTEEFKVKYDDLQKPVKDRITVDVSIPSKNVTFDRIVKDIEIQSYSTLEDQQSQQHAFLKRTRTYSVKNIGNVDKETTIKENSNWFRLLFSSFTLKPTITKDKDMRVVSWALTLAPMESYSVSVTENYRPLFLLLIIVLVVVILYFILRSPVIVKKDVTRLGTAAEDMSEFKVLLHIKNRTGRIIDNVKIIDKIPYIAELKKEFGIGTLHPQKIVKQEKKGTIVTWQLPSLECYEERIITYKLRSRLKIIGEMRLPPTLVRYKSRKGGSRKSYSNKVFAD